jgi:uroporphyrinogen decarboxylase
MPKNLITRGPEKMSPKERVMRTLASQEADRVPIGYAANPWIDRRLKEYFGLAANDGEGLCQILGVDSRGIWEVPRYTGPRLHPEMPNRNVNSLWGIRTAWVEHESGGYWDYVDFPLATADEETVAKWPMPNPDDYDYSGVRAACLKKKPYAVIVGGAGLGDIINTNGMIRTMEQTLIDLATDEPAGLLLAKRRTEINLEITRRTLEAAQGAIDFMWMGEDLGTQKGPLISRELYRKNIRPLHQKFVDLAKSFNLPVIVHTCGSSSWVYEDFIKMGIKAVDTLQPECTNMEPAYLKKTFGGRLAFNGCISTGGAVGFGTAVEVERVCRETLDIMMPGGGYMFAPAHCLQDNSPTENVVAMYTTVHRHGFFNGR